MEGGEGLGWFFPAGIVGFGCVGVVLGALHAAHAISVPPSSGPEGVGFIAEIILQLASS